MSEPAAGLRYSARELELAQRPEEQGSILVRLAIASYELGDLSKSIFYLWRLRSPAVPGWARPVWPDTPDCRAYRAEARLAMGDLLLQLRLLAYLLDIDMAQAFREGEQRHMEKQKEIKDGS